MKTIFTLVLAGFVSVTVLSSFSSVAYAAAPGAMSGKGDYATRGYYQAAKQKKMKATKPSPKQR